MINQWFYCLKTIFISILNVVIKTIYRLTFLRSKPGSKFNTSVKFRGWLEISDYQFFIFYSVWSMVAKPLFTVFFVIAIVSLKEINR